VLCEHHLDVFIKACRNYGAYDIESALLFSSNVIYVIKTPIHLVWIFALSSLGEARIHFHDHVSTNVDEIILFLKNQASQHNVLMIHNCVFDAGSIKDIRDISIQAIAQEYVCKLNLVMHRYQPQVQSKPKYNNSLFRKLYQGKKTAFIIMKFSKDERFNKALEIIKSKLAEYGIIGIRADEEQFASTIWENIKVYMDNADYGIAIAESVEDQYINSNVSVEIGYMLALKKKVCLLKEKSLDKLHSDFAGIIYNEFDIDNVEDSLPKTLEKWMRFEKIVDIGGL
jgi:hypothetical protein